MKDQSIKVVVVDANPTEEVEEDVTLIEEVEEVEDVEVEEVEEEEVEEGHALGCRHFLLLSAGVLLL